MFRFSLRFFVHRFHPVRIAASSYGKLIVGVNQRLGKRGVEVMQDMQNLEQGVLPGRGKVDFVRVTGGDSSVWLLGSLSHDHTSPCKSLICRELSPEMPEERYEMTDLVMMTTRRALTPHFDSTAEKHHPASGVFGAVRIELLKHTSDRQEWERGGIVMAH